MKKLLMMVAVCAAGIVCAERVVFVGDSITGLSENSSTGYAKQMRRALADAGRSNALEIVCLGGSGQTVQSWRNIVKMSATTNLQLDVKTVFVKDELDKPADTMIIFLGMNDALSPSVGPDEKAKWLEQYQTLIDLLKGRTKVGRILLAQPTMYTENPDTYKNGLMRTFCSWIDDVAATNGFSVIRTHEAYQRVWESGRLANPDFRMTYDYVHPGTVGHLAIADAFLRALGETKAADAWYEKNLKSVTTGAPGALLYFVNPGELCVKGRASFDVRELYVTVPAGWTVKKEIKGRDFRIVFANPANVYPEVTEIPVTVSGAGASVARTVKLHAPWLVKNGFPGRPWSLPERYPFEEHKTAVDAQFAAGAVNFADWRIYVPNSDVNGGAHPGSIDFCSLENGRDFDFAYAAVNVISPRAGKMKMVVRTRVFSGTMHDTVWLNGVEKLRHVFYRNQAVPQEQIVELKAGVNTVWLKCAHQKWQWQSSVHFEDGDIKSAELTYALPGVAK